MADKEEVSGENTARDWEVVSLTASAYAASPAPGPNPKLVESKGDDNDGMEAETSHPLYMSRHFVFPPSEHSTEPSDLSEIFEDKASKMMDFGFPVDQETVSGGKEDGEDLTLKGLDLAGLEFFEEKGKSQEYIYKTAMEDERAIHEQTEPVTSHPTKDEVAPCEPWWKRSAASLISQAKETNTVLSIFIAAAVMGVVILGQQQILQLKWESSIGNEKAGRFMGPITRLKQAFVGIHSSGSVPQTTVKCKR